MAAHPAEFNIDNLAGADLDRFSGVFGGVNGFIQTDGRIDLFLKLGMIDQVFIVQRLLEHHEVVLVHVLEHAGIGQRIRRIRITHER